MSDLFGNHIVGFSTRWLIYGRYKLELPCLADMVLTSDDKRSTNFRTSDPVPKFGSEIQLPVVH